MIPKTFRQRNRNVVVKPMTQQLSDELKRHGDFDTESYVIRLAPNGRETLEHTFFHELAHCLLMGTTKPKLTNNEQFVDSLGAMIHQYMQTQKGEYKNGSPGATSG